MRSTKEVLHRLRQEAANLRLLILPERLRHAGGLPPLGLPAGDAAAAALAGTQYARDLVAIAESILNRRWPLLGMTVECEHRIAWRRDFKSGMESGTDYFRRVPYLNAGAAGDHKNVWELSRHQHLMTLAQAFLITGRPEFRADVVAQLEHWWEENPFQRGINWCSALEVGFRALSWIWIYHWIGHTFEPAFRQRFLERLYWHGCHLEYNLSYFFSRNTHLLGEAVALHALGALFPDLPRSRRWNDTGHAVVCAEMEYQTQDDGSHFEHSSYYHVYALDFFLLHALIAPDTPDWYAMKLERMAEYLDALHGTSDSIPLIGDDDGGRLFHPFGVHTQYGRASLATAGVWFGRPEWIDPGSLPEQAVWWLGPQRTGSATVQRRYQSRSRLFPNIGIANMRDSDMQVIVDCGPFGGGRGGHSHADTLQVLVRDGANELLLDPGTYTYVGDPNWRDWFRGTGAHNTIRVDGADQATTSRAFGWDRKPEVSLLEWHTSDTEDRVAAQCSYRDVRHVRFVVFRKPHLLVVYDHVTGARKTVEQFWHAGVPVEALGPHLFRLGERAVLSLAPGGPVTLEEGGVTGWASDALGRKREAPALCHSIPVDGSGGSVVLAAAVSLAGSVAAVRIEQPGTVLVGDQEFSFEFGTVKSVTVTQS